MSICKELILIRDYYDMEHIPKEKQVHIWNKKVLKNWTGFRCSHCLTEYSEFTPCPTCHSNDVWIITYRPPCDCELDFCTCKTHCCCNVARCPLCMNDAKPPKRKCDSCRNHCKPGYTRKELKKMKAERETTIKVS